MPPGNIVSTGMLAQDSKHIHLAQFLLFLTLQGAATCSQEQAREGRKALLSEHGRRGGANMCSHPCENPRRALPSGLYQPGLQSVRQKMKSTVT